MRLNEVTFNDVKPIDGYGAGFFRVGGEVIDAPVCVGPNGVTAWGGYDDTDTLLALTEEIDVLFIGTGSETAHVPAEFRARLEDVGIGVEAMNSPAAARTYNVLISEGRRVAAALLGV
ncbi:Mth938-like domain-containing protein [Roseovarius aestuariivivens]|uniref:Mth938-like domain-containing protein n=1 Tax=Roseovarius aestuariivivens TaxID=1888910 RepID=UPI001080EC5C|nr:Mth938-like domain-containing protein [Roseovarius aestuariivivens]